MIFLKIFFFSNLEIKKKKNFFFFISANGCYGKIFFFSFELNLIYFFFPSQKIFKCSFYCFSKFGRNAKIKKKYEIDGKSNYFLKFFKKKKVRGVAKNPIDHPHGGRTKTNKPEVSI
jgi:ribosomal protein L2